jgi:hypothetical protein
MRVEYNVMLSVVVSCVWYDTQCHLPEDDNHHSHRRGNLQSYNKISIRWPRALKTLDTDRLEAAQIRFLLLFLLFGPPRLDHDRNIAPDTEEHQLNRQNTHTHRSSGKN